MKRNHRIELLGLGLFTGLMMVMIVSGQSTSAASQAPGSGCTLFFSGSLTSLQMSPVGAWSVASSSCNVTDQSGGITTGTFTGTFTSNVFNGIVSGTWSLGGGTQKVVASSTGFTLSFSADQGVDKIPVLGSTYQGTLSGTGIPMMFTVGTVGQVGLK